MKKIKRICIISSKYPTEKNPEYTFVDQLVCSFADKGIECVVISPYSISRRIVRKTEKLPYKCVKLTRKGNKIVIFRPRYISFSSSILNINTSKATYYSFRKSVLNVIKKRKILVDAVYGHFLYPSGLCAADIGYDLKIPSFLAYGESSFDRYKNLDKSFLKSKIKKLNGIISVSNKNKEELIELGLIDNEKKIKVFPNGVDPARFYQVDKTTVRKELNIREDIFVISFLGQFIDRKGINILSRVLNTFEDVHSIFIGSGIEEPNCHNILFKGKVPHDMVYKYLNASDVFVLPTKAEGCSNAIIEAMACGLPIISSNLSFNDDILDESCSLRIDPNNESELYNAIKELKNNSTLRKRLSIGSLKKAKNLSLNSRAERIITFMEELSE